MISSFQIEEVSGISLACVASVSNRVIARKSAGAKNKGGRGRGRGEEETLAPKPHDSGKRPLTFHSLVDLQIDSSSKQKYNKQITPVLPDL